MIGRESISRRDRVLNALVDTIERFSKKATTAAEVEALAAAVHVYNELEPC